MLSVAGTRRRKKSGAIIASLGEICGIVLLQTLAVWHPASAGEEQAQESAYFSLVVATCYTCHSAGNDDNPAIPALEGLTEARIRELLTEFKSGARESTIMNRISQSLTETDIDRISTILGRREH